MWIIFITRKLFKHRLIQIMSMTLSYLKFKEHLQDNQRIDKMCTSSLGCKFKDRCLLSELSTKNISVVRRSTNCIERNGNIFRVLLITFELQFYMIWNGLFFYQRQFFLMEIFQQNEQKNIGSSKEHVVYVFIKPKTDRKRKEIPITKSDSTFIGLFIQRFIQLKHNLPCEFEFIFCDLHGTIWRKFLNIFIVLLFAHSKIKIYK